MLLSVLLGCKQVAYDGRHTDTDTASSLSNGMETIPKCVDV